jgi:cation diffusion facilitator CzcD-associated flavoprotein CzcO
VRVAVIGAGISGIIMGCRLQQAGIRDFVVLEKAERAGGTWRDNTYPGVACDIPSHLYCYSSELNPDRTYRYAPGTEILRYIEQIIDKHGLSNRIRYGQEVSSARWDGRRWNLSTRDGAVIETDVVVSATGVLHHPAYPQIEGLDQAAFPVFHTARWRNDVLLGFASRSGRDGAIGKSSKDHDQRKRDGPFHRSPTLSGLHFSGVPRRTKLALMNS